MKIKGIVMAGGKGTRLYPLTTSISKHLLPIFDKPMIYFPLELLISIGIQEILIITSPDYIKSYQETIGENGENLFGIQSSSISIHYAHQDVPTGVAEAFAIAKTVGFLESSKDLSNGREKKKKQKVELSPVVLILGDNVFFPNNKSMFVNTIQKAISRNSGATLFAFKMTPSEIHRYGVVEFKKENEELRVLNIEEKPNRPKSNYAVTGLYVYDHRAASFAEKLTPSLKGELEITSLNKEYLRNDSLDVVLLDDQVTWFDAGTHEDLFNASQFARTYFSKSISKRTKTILVTGGCGFMGSNFVEYFVKNFEDYFIVNIDILTYAGSLENTREFDDHPRYTFVHGNITDRNLIESLFRQYQFDGIIHFAAESHVDNSIENSTPFCMTNIVGTQVLLDVAKSFWLKKPYKPGIGEGPRFLYISTDEVYGSIPPNSSQTFNENSNYAPNNPYSASKASSELLVRSYFKTYGLNVVVTNSSNNFGPKQHLEKLIPTVIRKAIAEQPIPIYGKGSNIRDWIFVNEHSRAVSLAFFQGKPGERYNIGGSQLKTNIDLARWICQALDKLKPLSSNRKYEELITFVEDRLGHDFKYAVDTNKIEKELGFKVKQNFEKDMLHTIRWFLNQLQNEKS